MDIKKREFLAGSALIGTGLAAATQAQAQTQSAPTHTMLDSPNYFGTASKGGGIKKSWARTLPQISTADPHYKPRRVNKAIELWEDNQVVYYNVYMPSGAPDGYDEGMRMVKTYCDAINYEMENGSLDFSNLRNFMQGMADGGPTPSGHRTPMVFVTLPAVGFDGPSMRANAWQIQQALAAGAHGVLICEMHSPEAGEIAISCARTKYTLPGIPYQPIEGSRGSGSQVFAAHVWGLSGSDYLAVADTWPLNPKGEISMGFKLENRHAVENCEQIMAIKGLAFAEPGPSDNSWSILGWDAIKPMSPDERKKVLADPRLVDALERVRLAAKKNGVQWLGTGPPGSTHNQSIDAGMRMLPGDDEKVVMAAREYTKRKMPA